jgi:hydrogenase maturation protease
LRKQSETLLKEVQLSEEQILILGVGNILYSDEGFGVMVADRLYRHYEFPDHVTVMDGNVMGINLLGVVSDADRLIVVDAVRNNGSPGDFHRLEGEAIPKRILAKNSLHQVDLLEALTLCQAMDKQPETVILGAEPCDITTLKVGLTPALEAKLEEMIQEVLRELEKLGVSAKKREEPLCASPFHPESLK